MEQDQIMTDSSDCLSLSNLPPNVISKIVQKLPVSYRKNFALTCKDYYKIVCHEDRFKYYMSIGDEKLNEVYDSVMASDRVFDVLSLWISLDVTSLDLLTRIAAKHGSTIKRISFFFGSNNSKLKATQFQKFLKEFPNLIEFTLSDALEFYGEPEPVLQNIKVFKTHIYDKTEKYKAFINDITKFMKRNTLENCDIHVKVPQSFEKIFERQRNVKKILLFNGCESSTIFKHLKLERIEFYGRENEDVVIINQIIRDHAETLREIRAESRNSRNLDVICNQCTNLESLWLTVNEENVASLLQISRLKKLKELRINFDEDFAGISSLNNVANIKMMSIKKLIFEKFTFNNALRDVQIPEEVLDNFSKNWPNIEEISLCTTLLPLNRVVLKFKKLEVLDFDGYYLYDGHVHPGVKKLVINNRICIKNYFPPDITRAFPNLKSLKVMSCYFLGASQLKALNDMRRLKELYIGFDIDFDLVLHPEDIYELKKLMHRLEVCEIQFHAPNNFIDELAERLEGEVFEIADFDYEKMLYIKIKY